LIVAAVVDEEHSSIGADALVEEWSADAAVVTEPTDLEIAVVHKGFAWLEVDVRGLAAHGSRPKEGEDAILRMGRVLAHLEALDRALQARPPHPMVGTASLHASMIEGGRELCSYPDFARLQMERRTVPGEAESAAIEEVQSILDGLHIADPMFRGSARQIFSRPAYELSPDHELPRALAAAVESVGARIGDCRENHVDFLTPEVAALARVGVESAHRDARLRDPEFRLQFAAHDEQRFGQRDSRQRAGHVLQRQMGRGQGNAQRRHARATD
jgi:acetylornithine deacetylase